MIKIENLINKLPWHATRRWASRDLSKIKKIVVHQELGEGSIEAVNNYHVSPNHISSKGCPHFCYHYGIRKDGEIVQANELSSITWHVGNHNTESIGIMIQGNFDGPEYDLGTSEPTKEQIQSLGELVDYLIKAFEFTNQDVYGHFHFGKPACPGYVLQKWVEEKRKDISDDEVVKVEKTLKEIQKRLNKLGYAVGPVDGIHGIKTLAAIRRFQKDQQLEVDGVVAPRTWQRLVNLTL